MSYYIHADKFFLKNITEIGGYLEVTDDGKFGVYYHEDNKPAGKIVEQPGKWIAPGYVDTHIHGLLGHDVMDLDWEGIEAMSEGLLKAGVTSWLPTTLTASFDDLNEVCKIIGAHYTETKGAKIRGIHFEGPFYTEKHKGAQNPKYFSDPDIVKYEKWQESAHGMLKKISIAAEREGAAEFTRKAVADGAVVALGHSDATYEQARACIEAGASMFTHTFNGMSPMSHHAPGMAGAAMATRLMDDELITDGHHVQEPVVRALVNAKGPEHIALITDCMKAGMMPDGDYTLGEFPVYVKDGMARLKDGDNLAGSILQMKDGVKNIVDWNVVTPEDAVMMASYVPAKSAKIDDVCGYIAPDKDADFIVLNPDMTVAATYIDGDKKYEA